ncbi:MAG: NUDIX domain-containing protein [Microgenomates group bacterium]
MITCTFENGNVAKPGIRHITTSNIIIRNGQVLMCLRGTKNGQPILESGKWGLLGGFMDRDETIIQSVQREVMEESGWEIDTPELFRINDYPGRPMEDRQNVDFIFIAHVTKQIAVHDEEVKELKWFSLDALPPQDQIAFDHGEDLRFYIEHLRNPKQLPLLG